MKPHRDRPGLILELGGSEHAPMLAKLLDLHPDARRALVALATDPRLQQGVIEAIAECWPEELGDLAPARRISSSRNSTG